MDDSDIKSLLEKGRIVITIHHEVYDITPFMNEHPGGTLVLQHASGKDNTDLFSSFHSKKAWELLSRFRIGTLRQPRQLLPIETDYRELYHTIRRKGYDKINPWLVLWLTARPFFWLLLAIICFIYQHTFGLTLGSIFFGLFFQQMAFLGHDSGHNSIFENYQWNKWYGYLVGNIATGISMAWWKSTHNVHHTVCNSIEHDPDIQHLPIMACSPDIITINKPTSWWRWYDLFYSSFHKKWMGINGLYRTLLSFQHIIFYPLMAIARLNLYIQSFYMLLTNKNNPSNRLLEIVSLCLHFIWHSLFVYSYTHDIPSFLYVVGLSHAVAGILHVQIIMSHFAMAVYHGYHDNWIVSQIQSSMNINCSEWMDWFHGGLQFQIEHHLFPRIPRYHLRAVSELVKQFCLTHNLPYVSVSFWKGNQMVYNTLRNTSNTAWENNRLLIDALNANG